jgi:hypothetical protein
VDSSKENKNIKDINSMEGRPATAGCQQQLGMPTTVRTPTTVLSSADSPTAVLQYHQQVRNSNMDAHDFSLKFATNMRCWQNTVKRE